MVTSTRPYSLRGLVSARATIAVIICAGALLFISQQLASGTVLQRLQYAHCSQCQSGTEVESSGESAYRQRLNAIRPLDRVKHSKTLGVADRIYVLHLPTRTDRYETMSGLERAMDLEFTWHNATDFHAQEVGDLLERLRWWRNEHRVDPAQPMADPSPFHFKWADDVDEQGPLGLAGADLWSDTFGKSPLPPLPQPPSPDRRPPTLDSEQEDGRTFGKLTILPAQVACWHSHYQMLRKVAEGEDEVAIIFEDDIDMEWDLEHRLRGMWEALPPDWDMVMIGHCLAQEWHYPALDRAPALHKAHNPLCTHAYAVNRRSARRIARYLRSEAFAYSRNIDIAINRLLNQNAIKVFSIYPPIVVQDQVTESDITPGRPQKLQPLEDSALERIALAAREDAAIQVGLDIERQENNV